MAANVTTKAQQRSGAAGTQGADSLSDALGASQLAETLTVPPFKFRWDGFGTVTGVDGGALRNYVEATGQLMKDGTAPTDENRLFRTVEFIYEKGDAKYAASNVGNIFYGGGFGTSGGKAGHTNPIDRVEFSSSAGASVIFKQGAAPTKESGPFAAYTGNDTARRQQGVDAAANGFYTTGESKKQADIGSDGSFLRMPGVEAQVFARFQQQNPGLNRGSEAYTKYKVEWANQYMRVVRNAAEPQITSLVGTGVSPQAMLQQAIQIVDALDVPAVFKVGNRGLTIEDEAVIQNVFKDMGYAVNIDVDNVAASTITR